MADHPGKIGIIVPDPLLGKLFEELESASSVKYEIQKGFLEEGVGTAKKFISEGIQILVSRGETCRLIREANLDAIVLEIPITVQDILSLVRSACAASSTIGLVGFGALYHAALSLAPILPVSFKIFKLSKAQDIEETVKKIIASGIKVIAGTPHVVFKCIEFGLTGFALQTRKAVAIEILEAASKISEIQANAKRFNLGREVANQVLGGETFLLDKNGKLVKDEITGKATVSPNLDAKLLWALQHGFPYKGEIHINNSEVRCSLHPIVNKGTNYGGLLVVKSMERDAKKTSQLEEKFPAQYTFEDIIHESPNMVDCVRQAKLYARNNTTICLRGESGTGKELFAQSIHNASSRSKLPFIAINCGAIPESLLTSELFGYGKGAFTGARQDGRTGWFELANGGTIFLDEINESSKDFQLHLLRILEERQFFKIGGEQPVKVNVRIICASNINLEEAVRQNRFRKDLYYRINILPLFIPPLRQRAACLPRLIDYFSYSLAITHNVLPPRITQKARTLLCSWHYPGNVRELRNLIERLLILSEGEPIDHNLVQQCLESANSMTASVTSMKDIELSHIHNVLENCNGNKEMAARKLGISKTTLWRRLKACSTPE